MEKKEFSTPDLPFALGVICVCAAGLGYQLFLLLPVLVVCRFINRKFLFFTLCGIFVDKIYEANSVIHYRSGESGWCQRFPEDTIHNSSQLEAHGGYPVTVCSGRYRKR